MTQPATLPSRPAAQTAAVVDVVRIGDLMQARHRGTGQILGTATRSGRQDEWIGWLVRCGSYRHEILTSPVVAEVVLRYMASLVASQTGGVL